MLALLKLLGMCCGVLLSQGAHLIGGAAVSAALIDKAHEGKSVTSNMRGFDVGTGDMRGIDTGTESLEESVSTPLLSADVITGHTCFTLTGHDFFVFLACCKWW